MDSFVEETEQFSIYVDKSVIAIYSNTHDCGYYFPKYKYRGYTNSELASLLKLEFPLYMEIGDKVTASYNSEDEYSEDEEYTYFSHSTFVSKFVKCHYDHFSDQKNDPGQKNDCHHFKCTELHGLEEKKERIGRHYCDSLDRPYNRSYQYKEFINYIPI